MDIASHPAADNVRCLHQGIDLVRQLEDEQFCWRPSGPGAPGGVGAQLRHCIDFYLCLLRGLDDGRVDYTRRDRSCRVETERLHAAETMEGLIAGLQALSAERVEQDVLVRLERPGQAEPGWCRSSVMRELQFLMSHTIHHFALIGLLLRLQGCELDQRFREFGVAPSTVSHWKATGTQQ